MSDNFLTSELIPLSRNLSNLGFIGLRALEFLADGKSTAPDWASQQLQVIEEMEKPVAEVRLGGNPAGTNSAEGDLAPAIASQRQIR